MEGQNGVLSCLQTNDGSPEVVQCECERVTARITMISFSEAAQTWVPAPSQPDTMGDSFTHHWWALSNGYASFSLALPPYG